MMDSLTAPKMLPLIKMSRSCTPWLCVIGGETFLDSQEMIMIDYHKQSRTINGAYNAGKYGFEIFLIPHEGKNAS